MNCLSRCFVRCLWLVTLVVAFWPPSGHADDKRTLYSGWTVFVPYSYVENVRGIPKWTGLDVELLHEIEKQSGYAIDASAVEWPDLVRGVETGEFDFAPTATHTAEREEFATFSVPYRTETMVLILPRGKSHSLPAGTAAELVDIIREKKFRLGVGESTAYPSGEFRAFIADPAHSDQVVEMPVKDFLQELLDGEIDGFLTDRIRAAADIEQHGASSAVEEHPVRVDGDLRLMFSKASVPPNVVADINRAIKEVRERRAYRQLNEKYTFPILVRLTQNSSWFIVVDIIGTIAFALSGVLLAIRYNYDIFGALVLASLPAVGDGVVRDLITNRETLAVLSSPIYIELVVGVVVGGFVVVRIAKALQKSSFGATAVGHLERRREQIGNLVQIFDAVGLAAFTVIGVVVAVATQSKPLWLWGPILAAITAAGGGILRDVVRSEPEISVLKGELYPEIAVFWGALLSFYMIWQTRHLNADEITLGVVITFLGAFLTRVASLYIGMRSPRLSV